MAAPTVASAATTGAGGRPSNSDGVAVGTVGMAAPTAPTTTSASGAATGPATGTRATQGGSAQARPAAGAAASARPVASPGSPLPEDDQLPGSGAKKYCVMGAATTICFVLCTAALLVTGLVYGKDIQGGGPLDLPVWLFVVLVSVGGLCFLICCFSWIFYCVKRRRTPKPYPYRPGQLDKPVALVKWEQTSNAHLNNQPVDINHYEAHRKADTPRLIPLSVDGSGGNGASLVGPPSPARSLQMRPMFLSPEDEAYRRTFEAARQSQVAPAPIDEVAVGAAFQPLPAGGGGPRAPTALAAPSLSRNASMFHTYAAASGSPGSPMMSPIRGGGGGNFNNHNSNHDNSSLEMTIFPLGGGGGGGGNSGFAGTNGAGAGAAPTEIHLHFPETMSANDMSTVIAAALAQTQTHQSQTHQSQTHQSQTHQSQTNTPVTFRSSVPLAAIDATDRSAAGANLRYSTSGGLPAGASLVAPIPIGTTFPRASGRGTAAAAATRGATPSDYVRAYHDASGLV